MRVFLFIVVTIGLLAVVRPTEAAQPAGTPPVTPPPVTPPPVTPPPVTPPPVTPIVELDQLAELGKAVAAIRYESDNVFFYTERAAALRRIASSLEGGQLEFVAKVMRVTATEVFVEVEPAGKTRLVLMHSALPVFGNLKTVSYGGVSSSYRLHIFSAPVGLRIGSEINLDVAKTLRRRNRLVIRGTIASLPVWIESVFAPDAVALISDWRVVEAKPEPHYAR